MSASLDIPVPLPSPEPFVRFPTPTWRDFPVGLLVRWTSWSVHPQTLEPVRRDHRGTVVLSEPPSYDYLGILDRAKLTGAKVPQICFKEHYGVVIREDREMAAPASLRSPRVEDVPLPVRRGAQWQPPLYWAPTLWLLEEDEDDYDHDVQEVGSDG